MRKLILCIISFLSLITCSTEEMLTNEQQRAIDAEFNSNITPGVRNVVYEKALRANSASQLIFKLTYKEDTLAAYGKINDLGKLEYIHTTVWMKKGGQEALVTEIFPATSLSRMYTIRNGVKGSIVIEKKYFSQSRYTISLIDLNWNTGVEKVVLSTLISDGTKISEFSGIRMADERVWNCDQPQPSDDLDKTVDNHLDYHACGGLAWDSHPSLTVIKETITSFVEKIKNSPPYANQTDQLNFLESSYKELSNLYISIKGKLAGYKFEETIMTGLLKQLEQSINNLKEDQYTIRLEPFEPATDTEYDEVTDNEIKITFLVTDVDTGLPFVKKPVFVDIAFVKPGTSTALDIQSKVTSEVNGMVTFKFDPTTIQDYEKYTALEARWDLSSNNWQKSRVRTISLNYIKPKVVYKSGAALPSTISYTNGQTQIFKLVNEDDRAILADYSQVTINNLTNSKIGYSLLKGEYDFSLKLYTNESTLQNVGLDVYYNSKKVQTIEASVMDSLEIYRSSSLGMYKVNNFKGNGPNSELFCELKENGVARYTIYNDPSWPDGYAWNVSWSIVNQGTSYFVGISGWYNGYPYIRDDSPLRYPVTSFKHHLDNMYDKL